MYFDLLNAVSYLDKLDGVIAIPGLDSYVLAARPDHEAALARVHRITHQQDPLLLLGCDKAALQPFWRELPDSGETLIRKYWPGALVLALPVGDGISASITAGQQQVKVMQPACLLLKALLSMMPGGVLAVCGANRMGAASICKAMEVYNTFGDDVDYVLPDDELVLEAAAPTVVSVQQDGEIHLLRSGGIVLD